MLTRLHGRVGRLQTPQVSGAASFGRLHECRTMSERRNLPYLTVSAFDDSQVLRFTNRGWHFVVNSSDPCKQSTQRSCTEAGALVCNVTLSYELARVSSQPLVAAICTKGASVLNRQRDRAQFCLPWGPTFEVLMTFDAREERPLQTSSFIRNAGRALKSEIFLVKEQAVWA